MSGRTQDRLRVAVIAGGQNCEHDVSLASAGSVRAALDPSAYDVAVLEASGGGRRVSPALEIVVPPGGLFDTEREYDGSAAFLLPADLPEPVTAQLSEAAGLGCPALLDSLLRSPAHTARPTMAGWALP